MSETAWNLELVTERLILRSQQSSDYEAWYAGFAGRLPSQHKYDEGQVDLSECDFQWFGNLCQHHQKRALQDKDYIFGVFLRETNQQLGNVDLSTIRREENQWVNLGYSIHNQYQNGTHRELFEIEDVEVKQFVDEGLHSHAYLSQPRKQPTWRDILKNPAQMAMPKVLEAHLENFFPFMGLMHGENKLLSLKECHFYLPESTGRSRVFVLMYMKAHSAIAHLLKGNLLKLIDVVEQDAKILTQIYPNSPQRIKLNNEVRMDWVQRNYESFPTVALPNLSR